MLPLLLAVLLLAPSVSFCATRLGLHVTSEERAVWNARRTDNVNGIGGITYKTMWDTRILNAANTFKAQGHPGGDGHWTGWTAAGCFPNGQRETSFRDDGWMMEKSAFVFLVTGDVSYATGVAQNLLSQVGLPGTDWTNDTKWCRNIDNTVTMIDYLPWLTRILYAYDYLLAGGYTGFTPTQKTQITTWFVNAALYWEHVVDTTVKKRFSTARNTPPSYASCDGVSCPGGDIGLTHWDGDMARSFSIAWHNPTSLTASLMGAAGILGNHAGLKLRASYFYKEFLRFSSWADGSIHDQSRWNDDPNTEHGVIVAWSHLYMQLQPMILLADHFARNGDASLYTYQSPGGLFGTGGSNVELLTIVRRLARLENNTEQAYASNNGTETNTTRLQSKPPATAAREANHVGNAMANVRFKNAEIETSYSEVLGTDNNCGGFGDCTAGAWGLVPDMLFMFGNQEAMDPYTFGPAATPDVTSNLTMHLTFDDGTGTTAQDSTANNHDGTLGSGASWATTVGDSPGATHLAVGATAEEKAIWQTRAGSGPYKVEWDAIKTRADAFVASPTARWDGIPAGQFYNGTGFGMDRGRDAGLRDAAFVYFVQGGSSYLNAAKAALLAQTTKAGTNFADTGRWPPTGTITGLGNTIGSWLRKMAYAYNYIRASVTGTDRTTLDNWFLNAGVYYYKGLDNTAGKPSRFPNRLAVPETAGNYLPIPPNGGANGPLYVGGPQTYNVQGAWENDPMATNATMAVIGVMLNHTIMKNRATRYVQEWLKFNVYPNGEIMDQSRWGHGATSGTPQHGYLYAGQTIGSVLTTADILYRAGYTNLFTYSTSDGMHGTAGGPKTILKAMQHFAKLTNGTIVQIASTDGHDGTEENIDPVGPELTRIEYINLAQGNLYYQDAASITAYTKAIPGAYGTVGCTAIGGAQGGGALGGDWCTLPAVRFMYGGLEGVSEPYGGLANPGLPAKIGPSAVALDGTTNGIVTVAGKLGSPAAVTLAAWVKADAFPTPSAHVVSISDHVMFAVSPTTIQGFYYNGTTWNQISAARTLGTTAWHHIAYTVATGAGGVQRLYLDGENIASGTQTAAISYAGLGTNTILGGHAFGSTNFRFQGALDDVRVYSRALSAVDIGGLAALTTAPLLAVQITSPTSSATYNATSSPITNLGGTAMATTGVESVTYDCPDCAPAIATPVPALCTPACGPGVTDVNWTIPSIGLTVGGNNVVTVTASDGTTTQEDSLAITYTPGVPDFTSNLTMHLPFNEGTLTTAQDSTVNNHDGTLSAGASWGSAQMGANAVVLNGTTTGIVTVTGELGTPADVTLAAWVKISAFPTPTQDIISIGDSVILRTTATTVRGQYYTGTGWTSLESAITLGTTAWHHLAFTVTGGTQKLYVDGVNVATGSNSMAIVYTGLGANTILGGHANGATTNFRFQGSLDDVRVYSRALRPEDIAGLADLEDPPPLSMQITVPTTDSAYATTATPLANLGGTASDGAGVTGVTYTCPSCSPPISTSVPATCSPACGAETQSVNWTIPSIGLAAGSQVITVTAADASGSRSDTLTVTYTPPTTGGAACTHYAAHNGLQGNSGTAQGSPYRVVDFWGKGDATPGRTLCLLPGTYTGGSSLLNIPSSVIGTSSQRITIRALTDGTVLINGGNGGRPLNQDGQYVTVEGINFTGGDNKTCALRGSNNIARRIVCYDGGDDNVSMGDTLIDMGGINNLIEDCGGFGKARKTLGCTAAPPPAHHNTIRRCWVRWEDNQVTTSSPTDTFEVGYGQDQCTMENIIATRTVAPGGRVTDPEAIGGAFRTWGSQILGSIFYVGQNDTFSPNVIYQVADDAGSPPQHGDFHTMTDFVSQYIVTFIHPSNSKFGSTRGINFFRNYNAPINSGIRDSLSVSGVAPSVTGGFTSTNVRHGTSVAAALSGSGHSNIWTLLPGVCKRYSNRVLTTTGLWPFPMNQRISDAMGAALKTPVDVTATMQSFFGTIPASCLSGSIEEETCTPPLVGTPPNCACPAGTVPPNCDPEIPPDTCPPDCPVQDVFVIATTGSPGPAGSDANACTLDAPCATITRARSLMTPGDTLYLRGGTYTGANNRIATSTSAFPAGNDWTTPTRIAAYGGETVVLQQSSGQLVTFSNPTTDRYVVMDRLTLDGATTGGNDTKCLVTGSGVHHIRFQNGTLRNCHFTALDIVNSNSIEILNTTIHGTSHAQGASVSGASDSVLFDGTTFHTNAGHGLNASASGVTNLTVKNSISRTNTGTGFQLGSANLLAYNLLAYSNALGVRLTSLTVDGRLYYATVADNSGVEVQVDTGATDTLLTNVLAVGGITDNGTDTVQTTNYTGDPGFVSSSDYHLAADTSPAVDTGTCLPGVVDVALDTIPRPQPTGGDCDIGSYERAGAGGPPLPTPGALSARPYGSRLLLVP